MVDWLHLCVCVCVCAHVRVCVSCSVMSDSLWPHGLSPARFLCPWNSPGKNTGMDCHSLLQRNFPTQESNPVLMHGEQILYRLSYRKVCSLILFLNYSCYPYHWTSQVVLVAKNLFANAGNVSDIGSIPGSEDPLEEGMATNSRILAWRIPWIEGPARLWSTESQRVGRDRSNLAHPYHGFMEAKWTSNSIIWSIPLKF